MTARSVRCVECREHGHPGRVVPRSYCEHRTCIDEPCWTTHTRTCPGIITATTGRAPTTAPATGPAPAEVGPVQGALFEVGA